MKNTKNTLFTELVFQWRESYTVRIYRRAIEKKKKKEKERDREKEKKTSVVEYRVSFYPKSILAFYGRGQQRERERERER